MQKLFSFIKSPRFGELVRYGVIGLATTAVNYGIYVLITGFAAGEPGPLLINAALIVSWLVSVLFAFFTNKLWVFGSRGNFTKELAAFFGARVASLLFDAAFVNIAVRLGMADKAAKLLSNVFVIIINYVASRVIFKNKGEAR